MRVAGFWLSTTRGAVMEASFEQVGTLRAADHGHAPAIIDGPDGPKE